MLPPISLKRYVKLTGIASVMLILPLYHARCSSLAISDFNDGTVQGWTSTTTAGSPTPIVAAVPGGSDVSSGTGGSVLEVRDSAASGASTFTTLSKSFSTQTGGFVEMVFKIRFLASGFTPEKGDWRVALEGANGTIYLRMNPGGANSGFSYYDATQGAFVPSSITSVRLNDWYEIRISADLVKKKYGWTVRNLTYDSDDQKARIESAPFFQSGGAAFKFSIISVARGGNFDIDDVRISGMRNNLAEGTLCQFSQTPNYSLCSGTNDSVQAVDGSARAPGLMSPGPWTLPDCIGWTDPAPPVSIKVDLGAIKPISGFSINMAAGTASGVAWPAHVLCFTSTDNTNWYYLTDLVYQAEISGAIPSDGAWSDNKARVYKFSGDVQSHGRYVYFSVLPGSSFVFTDEVQVHEGDSAWLSIPFSGTSVSGTAGVNSFATSYRTKGGILKRIALDNNELFNEIGNGVMSPAQKANLYQNLTTAVAAAQSYAIPSDTACQAIMPLNPGHGNMLAIQGNLWQTRGVTQPVIWRKPRYAWLPYFHTPPPMSNVSAITSSIMSDDVRAEPILISNPLTTPITVTAAVENIPGLAGWLTVFGSDWTDTFQHAVVSSVLNLLAPTAGKYSITVPPGMTKMLWFQIDGNYLTNGSFSGDMRFTISGTDTVVPWNLRVSLMTLQKPRLAAMMWDYLNGAGLYALNPSNRPQAYSLMKSHFVQSVWGSQIVLPTCSAADFSGSNTLIHTLNYTAFDNWILNECPGAPRYFVFYDCNGTQSGGSTFAGVSSSGTSAAAFNARVGAWTHAIANRMAADGVDPAKLTFHILDEPAADWQFSLATQWFNAIKAGDSRVKCFTDPIVTSATSVATFPAAMSAADTISPLTYIYSQNAPLRDYYQQKKAQGKELYFYLCSGPAKLADPIGYYRFQAWYTFRQNGSGMGFWSLGDTGGTASSWNEYIATRDGYTPLFVSPTAISTSVQYEAIREGIEDNELFSTLNDTITAGSTADLQSRWTDLKTRIDGQLGSFGTFTRWPTGSSDGAPDIIRTDAIKLLENANGLNIP